MKSLREYFASKLNEDAIDDFEKDNFDETPDDSTTYSDGLNLALVLDIKLYSDKDPDFCNRKYAIADTFRKELNELETTTERIEKSKIFDIYIKHLMMAYKRDVNEDANVNVASENELRRLISADMVLLIKDIPF